MAEYLPSICKAFIINMHAHALTNTHAHMNIDTDTKGTHEHTHTGSHVLGQHDGPRSSNPSIQEVAWKIRNPRPAIQTDKKRPAWVL